jgi:hypothetical protein
VFRATILFITRSDGPVRRLLIGLRPPFRRNFWVKKNGLSEQKRADLGRCRSMVKQLSPCFSLQTCPDRREFRVDSTRLCRPSGEQNWSLHHAKSGQFFKKKKVVLITLITKVKALSVLCFSLFLETRNGWITIHKSSADIRYHKNIAPATHAVWGQ